MTSKQKQVKKTGFYVRHSAHLSKKLKDAERKLMRPGKTLTGFRNAFFGWLYWLKLCIGSLENKLHKLSKRKAMDKKMHKVTKEMKVAEKNVKAGRKEMAVRALKSAEKKNEKLVKIDKQVRDPKIKKFNKIKKLAK